MAVNNVSVSGASPRALVSLCSMIFRSMALFSGAVARGVHVNGGSTASRRIVTTTGLTGMARFIRGLPSG